MGQNMKWLLCRIGVYWPTILKNCIKISKSSQECQKHSRIQHVSGSELHCIVKPWPFIGWDLDIIGEIKHTSPKRHMYILMGINYLLKWVEAVALTKVDQEEVIASIQNQIIHRFGTPETIMNDQGIVFTRRKMTELAAEIRFKLETSMSYYGQFEAANKVIISLIKKHVGRNPISWHMTLGM